MEEAIVRWTLLETLIKLVDARCGSCKPMQCIFCLSNERKSYQGRTAQYARPNKMMNEAERHLKRVASDDPIPCPHPSCTASELVLPHVMAFKNHTAMVYKILLRA